MGGTPTCVEVFAGGGLLTLAFVAEGFDLLALCERDPHAVGTLRMHFDPPGGVDECDAQDFTPPSQVDVLFGGPPCQPFSQAGHRLGPDDPRHRFDDAIRMVRQSSPRVFVWENVPGILRESGPIANWRRSWWKKMSALGYEGSVWTMQAADYGTPQYRRRVFFVGWRRGDSVGSRLRSPPRPTHGPWGDPAVESGAVLPWVPAAHRLTAGCCGLYGLHSCVFLNNLEDRCTSCWEGSNYTWAPGEEDEERTEVPDSVVPLMMREVGPRGERRIDKHPPVDLSMGMRPRVRSGYLAPTLTASLAKGAPQGLVLTQPVGTGEQLARGHLRYLSVREAAKLQDVPQWYAFDGPRTSQLRQIGNGVPVNLGRAVARHVLRALGHRVPLTGSLAASPYDGLWPLAGENPCAQPQYELLIEARRLLRRSGRRQQRITLGSEAGLPARVAKLEHALGSSSDTAEDQGLAALEPGDVAQRSILDMRGR